MRNKALVSEPQCSQLQIFTDVSEHHCGGREWSNVIAHWLSWKIMPSTEWVGKTSVLSLVVRFQNWITGLILICLTSFSVDCFAICVVVFRGTCNLLSSDAAVRFGPVLGWNPRTLNWTFGPVQANFRTLNLGPVRFGNFRPNLCLIWWRFR